MKTKKEARPKATAKYAMSPEARLQRKQAAKKSAEVRKASDKWVGTSVTVKNKEYAVATYGTIDEALNVLRRVEESLNGVSIKQFLEELAASRKPVAAKKGGR